MYGRISTLLLLVLSLNLISCSGEPGTADVQGLPALKKPAESEQSGGVTGMGMDPAEHMMMRLDKNKDNKLEGSEIPEGLPKGYDQNEDGIITKEEIVERYNRMKKDGKGGDQKTSEEKPADKTAGKKESSGADESETETGKPGEKK